MRHKKKIFVFASRKALSEFAVRLWLKLAKSAIKKRGRFAVALSGGKTPIDFYKTLSVHNQKPLWAKTHIFMADERMVPFAHSFSNRRMIYKNLLNRIRIPKENFHPILTAGRSAQSASKEYEKNLQAFFRLPKGKFPRFDLVVLSVGQDGHTASLFPKTSALKERQRLAVANYRDGILYERVTLTFPVLNSAAHIVFIVLGKEKAKTVCHVIKGKGRLPAIKVNPQNGRIYFLLDKEAASQLL